MSRYNYASKGGDIPAVPLTEIELELDKRIAKESAGKSSKFGAVLLNGLLVWGLCFGVMAGALYLLGKVLEG